MTQKHRRLIGQNVSSPPKTPNEVMEEMDKLEEMKDDMSSGEYMNECNRLMELYYKLKEEDIFIRQFIMIFQ